MRPQAHAPRVGTMARMRSHTGGTNMTGHRAKIAFALTLYLVLQLAALYAAVSLWVK